jgi:hypothetical protein
MGNNIKLDLPEMSWQANGTASGSCPMVGFGTSGVETYGSATAVLVNE